MAVELETCPICKTRAEPLDKIGDTYGFECANHGRFRVAESIFAISRLRDAPMSDWERALARARARQPSEWAATIMESDFDAGSPAPAA
jgi:hypothetical protein